MRKVEKKTESFFVTKYVLREALEFVKERFRAGHDAFV